VRADRVVTRASAALRLREEVVLSKRPLISIVDDDESVRVATESLVRSLGFEAAAFASGEELLRWERLGEADCVVTDVQMPGMSGLELQARLIDDGRALPVIFITAFPEERLRRRAEAAGAYGFLSKPFDGTDMINCLDAALGRHAGR